MSFKEKLYYIGIGVIAAALTALLLYGELIINEFEILCNQGKCYRVQLITNQSLLDSLKEIK